MFAASGAKFVNFSFTKFRFIFSLVHHLGISCLPARFVSLWLSLSTVRDDLLHSNSTTKVSRCGHRSIPSIGMQWMLVLNGISSVRCPRSDLSIVSLSLSLRSIEVNWPLLFVIEVISSSVCTIRCTNGFIPCTWKTNRTDFKHNTFPTYVRHAGERSTLT